jgi:hypothetical protein
MSEPVEQATSGAFLYVVQIGLVNAAGIAIGDGLPAEGASAGLQHYMGALSVGGTVPEPNRLNVIGASGAAKHTYQRASDENPTVDFSAMIFDMKIRAMYLGSKVQTIGDMQMAVAATDQDGLEPQVCIVASQKAIQAEAGTEIWQHEIWPLAKLTGGPFQMQSGQNAEYAYSGTANQAAKTPWGVPLSVVNNGVSRAATFIINSANMISLDTYVCDNGDPEEFTLQYTPAGDETTNKVLLFDAVAGTPISPGDVDVGTKVVQFPQDTAGKLVVALYEVAAGELP